MDGSTARVLGSGREGEAEGTAGEQLVAGGRGEGGFLVQLLPGAGQQVGEGGSDVDSPLRLAAGVSTATGRLVLCEFLVKSGTTMFPCRWPGQMDRNVTAVGATPPGHRPERGPLRHLQPLQ